MTSQSFSVPCFAVTQPIGTFYLAKMKAGDLLSRVAIHRRGLSEESQRNIQRELNTGRTKEIAAYVTDPDATFPTSIIIAAYETRVSVESENGCQKLVFGSIAATDPDALETDGSDAPPEMIGEVVDGQHRLMGLLESARSAGSIASDFELPVVFMLGLDAEHRAYVFSTINSKQNRVSSSLIIDLFGLAGTRSPRRTCHEVASAMNASASGPLFQSLKMLGKKTSPNESLTQGSFAKYLLPLIASNADRDERALKRRERLAPEPASPFRTFFLEERDDMILRILTNYLTAIKDVYPRAWEDPKSYSLRRTVGFAALMGALQKLWPKRIAPSGRATPDVFHTIAKGFAKNVPEGDLQEIQSSHGGAGRLRDLWLVGQDEAQGPV